MTDRTTEQILKAAERAIHGIKRDAKDGISLCHEERLTSLISELSAKLRGRIKVCAQNYKNRMDDSKLIVKLQYKLREREDKVSQLWQLLDDIDTLDDAAKDKDKSFRDSCYKIQQKRWDIYNPDLLPTPPKKED